MLRTSHRFPNWLSPTQHMCRDTQPGFAPARLLRFCLTAEPALASRYVIHAHRGVGAVFWHVIYAATGGHIAFDGTGRVICPFQTCVLACCLQRIILNCAERSRVILAQQAPSWEATCPRPAHLWLTQRQLPLPCAAASSQQAPQMCLPRCPGVLPVRTLPHRHTAWSTACSMSRQVEVLLGSSAHTQHPAQQALTCTQWHGHLPPSSAQDRPSPEPSTLPPPCCTCHGSAPHSSPCCARSSPPAPSRLPSLCEVNAPSRKDITPCNVRRSCSRSCAPQG